MTRKNQLEDYHGEIFSFAKAIIMSAEALAPDQACSMQVLAEQILERTERSRAIIDGTPEAETGVDQGVVNILRPYNDVESTLFELRHMASIAANLIEDTFGAPSHIQDDGQIV